MLTAVNNRLKSHSRCKQLSNELKRVKRQLASALNSKKDLENTHFALLDILPGGVSIATDISCSKIIHNPIAAKFLRINEWENFSHSSQNPPSVIIRKDGKILTPDLMPIQRSALLGIEIHGEELEFTWEDGVRKVSIWNTRPIKDENGNIDVVIATMEDITERKLLEEELKLHRDNLGKLVNERTKQLQLINKQLTEEIKKQKITEEALRASEKRFAKTFHNNPLPISIISVDDGRYIDVNRSWQALMGYEKTEIIGRTLFDFDFLHSFQLSYSNKLQDPIQSNEVVFRTKIGEKRYGLHSTSPITIDGKKCLLSTTYDITDKKRIEKEMSRLDRLNLIGEMAGGIGHEIRNPLTTVKGFLQIMQGKEDLRHYHEYIELMISEIERANYIITDFLSLSKTNKIYQTRENISEIVRKMNPLLQAHAYKLDKEVKLELESVPKIIGDEKEIRQLILNLVLNGLDASQPKESVTIKTYTYDDFVVLDVIDRGKGIPKKFREKIGVPFFTTKDNGTGLGLAVCYGIAGRHRAKISYETGANGTTFSVVFPIKEF
ncbi:PAS domain S-box protein [Heliobacterium chlorum]|uniref:histidine kinase n=1 Tax=Heliobacterium chlorum TaxID=2698 RepID=A0ABR7T8B1_HELCL|nr:PAS domain-containing sensor histidine kinase [Heliobacterium chlorum]MBC9786477.1 PAS domain S-box protein [Heliobacterium chlorum]